MISTESFGIAIGVIALVVSVLALYRSEYYFRGSSVTLANDGTHQRAIVLQYANVPASLRESFAVPDDVNTHCAIARLAWLNTGDRASCVYLSSVRAFSPNRGTSYPFFAYSYIDVAAGTASFQPVLVYDLDADAETVNLEVDYVWYHLTREGSDLPRGQGTLLVALVDQHGLTGSERNQDLAPTFDG